MQDRSFQGEAGKPEPREQNMKIQPQGKQDLLQAEEKEQDEKELA